MKENKSTLTSFICDVLCGLGLGINSYFSTLHIERLNTITGFKYDFKLHQRYGKHISITGDMPDDNDISIVIEMEIDDNNKIIDININTITL